MVVGAVVGDEEIGEVEEGAVVIRLRLQQARLQHQRPRRPPLLPSLISGGLNTPTFLPMLAGRALSTGRKAEVLHTVVIPWCANGSPWLHPGKPEMLASLVK